MVLCVCVFVFITGIALHDLTQSLIAPFGRAIHLMVFLCGALMLRGILSYRANELKEGIHLEAIRQRNGTLLGLPKVKVAYLERGLCKDTSDSD